MTPPAKRAKKSAEAPAKTIWYLLVDHKGKLSFGNLAKLVVQADTDVDDFKNRIKEVYPGLNPFEANKLEAWTYKHKDFSSDPTLEKLEEIVSRIKFPKASKNPKSLSSKQKLTNIDLPEDVILLVRVPSPQITDTAGGGDGNILSSELIKEYDAIFIYMKDYNRFQESDTELNKVWPTESAPEFVADYERRLDSKPALAGDVRQFLNLSLALPAGPPQVNRVLEYIIRDPPSRAAYILSGEVSTGGQPSREAGLGEIMHIREIASEDWETLWQGPYGNALKEDAANTLFFHPFIVRVSRDGNITAQLGRTPLPLQLIVRRADKVPDDEVRMYKPRSDFLVAKSTLPRLLVEVNSTATTIDWPEDRIRMLLSGASIFVLMVIFIRQNGEAIRHTLFQPADDPSVNYRVKRFKLGVSVARVEFTIQLYNLLHALEQQAGENDDDTRASIMRLNKKTGEHKEKYKLKSLRTRKGAGADDDASTGAGGGGVSETDSEDLRAHGYEVKSVIVDSKGAAFEPPIEMPPNILTVYRRSEPRKPLIAKKVCEESNEVEILKLLNNFQPKSEHIISLLDTFEGQSRTWAILPEMDSIKDYIRIAPHRLSEHVGQICWGLIKGIAYLHGHGIAHRDIKPDNLLVSKDFCLKVIDFDVAIKVKDEDEEVDGQCGTEGWMAPEVEARSSMYSPIRADRWSCGQVIIFLLNEFGKEDELLRGIVGKLKAHNPSERPSLLEWQISSVLPMLDSAKGRGWG